VSGRMARERQLLHPLRWQPPHQADRPRHARDIRGRIGLALDCRFGPGPRTVRCRARSSSDQGLQGLSLALIWIKAVG
jgi:hypothetical protein